MRRRWAGAVMTVLLAAAPRPGSAQTVGASVFESLRAIDKVRVIVSLREPQTFDLGQRAAAVTAMRNDVTGRVQPTDFRITHAYTAIPALAGEITTAGLAALLGSPDVVRVDLDPPVRAALAESVPLIHADAVHDMGFTGRNVV